MIREDFVSFETAKLLKEKGFDEECCPWYGSDGNIHKTGCEMRNSDCALDSMMAPTLQMAMKWLREEHNLHCDIGYDDLDWFWNIISIDENVPVEDRPKFIFNGFAGYKSYEEASEDAIKYCLENLI